MSRGLGIGCLFEVSRSINLRHRRPNHTQCGIVEKPSDIVERPVVTGGQSVTTRLVAAASVEQIRAFHDFPVD